MPRVADLRRGILAALLALTACTGPGPGPDEPIVFAPPSSVAASSSAALTGVGTEVPPLADARAAVDQLAVKGRAPKTGYSADTRETLFPHWSDVDGDGCDTRAAILARDVVPGTAERDRGGCVVGGEVIDPYTGAAIYEAPGRESEVDIEHVVALSDAWQKGAQAWSPQQREAFANDPLNLMAVDDGQNQAHGDGDAATWLPPRREYWCDYVARQVAVKHFYGLWVTSAEHDAMARVLDRCPGHRLPTHEETRP